MKTKLRYNTGYIHDRTTYVDELRTEFKRIEPDQLITKQTTLSKSVNLLRGNHMERARQRFTLQVKLPRRDWRDTKMISRTTGNCTTTLQ